MLEGILAGLPPNDPRRPALAAAAEAHRQAGLMAVTGEHYEGGHWLGSFAVYLTTQRGIERKKNNSLGKPIADSSSRPTHDTVEILGVTCVQLHELSKLMAV